MDDLELRGYFYRNPKRESDESFDFHRKLAEIRFAVEKLQIRKGVRKTVRTIAGLYIRYFTYKIDGGKIVTKEKNNAISAAENRIGRFLVVYRGKYAPTECLSLYRERGRIEKTFPTFKTDLNLFPMRVRKEFTIRGVLFVFFISPILRSALIRGMKSSSLIRKYSLEKMLLELEKLHMVEDTGGNLKKLKRTRKQKDILEALGGNFVVVKPRNSGVCRDEG